jgi:uncharacterized protein DUF4259
LETWGPGPFENDGALDWLLVLGKSDDPGLPESVLRRLDQASFISACEGEVAIVAVEAIAASRGHAAEPLSDEIHQWFSAANPRAAARSMTCGNA